jgi:glycosyltransferase involved in cell wall biosynthesis
VHDGLYYAKKCENAKWTRLWEVIEKTVYKRSKKIHFISDFSLKMSLLNKQKCLGKLVKIFNTTPLEHLTPITPAEKENPTFEVLIVSSIERRANLDLIFEVARLKKSAQNNIKFTIVGKGPLLKEYRKRKLLGDLDNIELLGYLPDNELCNYYKKCDLVLVPCLYGEGFGLPVIEGYLFNKPVVASNVCALPEVIITKNDLFENAPKDLIAKINEKIITGGGLDYYKYYHENFSNAVIQKKYRSLLYEL